MRDIELRKLSCRNCNKSVITEGIVGSVIRQKCPRCGAVIVFWVCEGATISRVETLTATPPRK